jgi:hypothetical protein
MPDGPSGFRDFERPGQAAPVLFEEPIENRPVAAPDLESNGEGALHLGAVSEVDERQGGERVGLVRQNDRDISLAQSRGE